MEQVNYMNDSIIFHPQHLLSIVVHICRLRWEKEESEYASRLKLSGVGPSIEFNL